MPCTKTSSGVVFGCFSSTMFPEASTRVTVEASTSKIELSFAKLPSMCVKESKTFHFSSSHKRRVHAYSAHGIYRRHFLHCLGLDSMLRWLAMDSEVLQNSQ